MDFYVIWPYFVAMVIVVSFANTPALRLADSPPTTVPARVQTIDGLRGFLALGVLFHHVAIYHQYLLTGYWALPPSRFYANLGQSGVAMFFMITGYLFWAKMLKAEGRPGFLRLYIGRVFRIVPLYLLLAFIVLLSVGVLTGWHLQEPPRKLASDILNWLAGGVILGGDVNGYSTISISAGVTWSLTYEWAFYVSLLATSVFARKPAFGAALPIAGLVVAAVAFWLSPRAPYAFELMFCAGMAAALVARSLPDEQLRLPDWLVSVAVVGCLGLALLGSNGIYHVIPIIILGVAFGLIVSGATVFGLLLSRPAKRLGDISYGIYLLQGPILFLTFGSRFTRPFVTASPWAHWATAVVAAIALVVVATVTHGVVERPGIKAGEWVWTRIGSSRHANTRPASAATAPRS